MVKSLDQMASQGSTKLSAKAASMTSSYNAAKGRMKTGYGEMPFGPTRKSNYNSMVDAGIYRAPDPAKWSRNWTAKQRE